jgi:hypothetical protein
MHAWINGFGTLLMLGEIGFAAAAFAPERSFAIAANFIVIQAFTSDS